jgi:hypothetical protein
MVAYGSKRSVIVNDKTRRSAARHTRVVTVATLSSLTFFASIGFDVHRIGSLRSMDLGVDPESGNLALILILDTSNRRASSEYSVNDVSFAVFLT